MINSAFWKIKNLCQLDLWLDQGYIPNIHFVFRNCAPRNNTWSPDKGTALTNKRELYTQLIENIVNSWKLRIESKNISLTCSCLK